MKVKKFVLVDDDEGNNFVNQMIIKRASPEFEVTSFLNPRAGLMYFEDMLPRIESNQIILLLDINMPEINGWEFLEELERMLGDGIGKISIYMLSSSVDYRDLERAKANPNITAYLSKPLVKDLVFGMATE